MSSFQHPHAERVRAQDILLDLKLELSAHEVDHVDCARVAVGMPCRAMPWQWDVCVRSKTACSSMIAICLPPSAKPWISLSISTSKQNRVEYPQLSSALFTSQSGTYTIPIWEARILSYAKILHPLIHDIGMNLAHREERYTYYQQSCLLQWDNDWYCVLQYCIVSRMQVCLLMWDVGINGIKDGVVVWRPLDGENEMRTRKMR